MPTILVELRASLGTRGTGEPWAVPPISLWALPLRAPSFLPLAIPVPHRRALAAYLRRPGQCMWLLGMLLFVAGNVLNFLSFAFAAQSLLAALAVVQFVANVVFARLINGEVATRRVLCATGVVIVGCVLLVAFGNHESPVMDADDLRHLYTAYVAGAGAGVASTLSRPVGEFAGFHMLLFAATLRIQTYHPTAHPPTDPHTLATWWGY